MKIEDLNMLCTAMFTIRWLPWKARKKYCMWKEIPKKGSPPTWTFCEHFCECWEHLDTKPEVMCECLDIEEACEEVR